MLLTLRHGARQRIEGDKQVARKQRRFDHGQLARVATRLAPPRQKSAEPLVLKVPQRTRFGDGQRVYGKPPLTEREAGGVPFHGQDAPLFGAVRDLHVGL